MILTGVLTLALAAFLLVMGLIMMDELMVDISGDTTNTTRINAALGTVPAAGTYLPFNDKSKCGLNTIVIQNVTFTANTSIIGAGNYTVNARTGQFTLTSTAATLNSSGWNISYTFKFGNSEACKGANLTITGQGSMGDYFDLIVLAIVIAVVIGLIAVFFSQSKKVSM